jgi:K+-sensing histidine kinase KdpD
MDLTAVLTECVRTGREKACLNHIEFSFDPPDIGKETVLADRNAMFSVFTNLIDNAVKYTPEGGRITVGLQSRSDQIAVSVEDTGIGIAAEHQQAAFDEFFRVRDRHTAAIPGTGLDLCVVSISWSFITGAFNWSPPPEKGRDSHCCCRLRPRRLPRRPRHKSRRQRGPITGDWPAGGKHEVSLKRITP